MSSADCCITRNNINLNAETDQGNLPAGIVYSDGDVLSNINNGTTGQILISTGTTTPPTFQNIGIGQTFTDTFRDNQGGTITNNISMTFVKVGRLVTVYIPSFTTTLNLVNGGSYLQGNTAIPTQFQPPSRPLNFPAIITNGFNNFMGSFSVGAGSPPFALQFQALGGGGFGVTGIITIDNTCFSWISAS